MPDTRRTVSVLLLLGVTLVALLAMACASDPEVITREVVVEKEVVKEVQVPGETVVVEKEVVREVEVIKTETVELIVTPTSVPVAMPGAINAPQPKGGAGIITIAIEDVPPGVGLGSTQLTDAMHYWGVGEVTMKFVAPGVVAPMLASAWELDINDAGKPYGATLTVRDGVIFHGEGLGDRSNNGGSWGPMTAHDIAFTINDGNNAVNNGSIHWQAGDFAAMFGSNKAVAVDDKTVSLTFNVDANGNPLYDPRWSANLLNDAAQAFSVQSKSRFDTVGKQEMQDTNFIGTGPLQIVEWVQDDTATLEAVPYDHWNANTKVDQIIFKEVGEQNTQIALMETGEVDAAPLLLKNLPRMLEGGFRTSDTGLSGHASVVFSGNLWETHHVISGAPLDTAAVYMRDLPWISNPDPSDSGRAPGISDADEGGDSYATAWPGPSTETSSTRSC